MKIRRTSDDVIRCGKLVADGFNVIEVEKILNIPKSTVHWVICNRLKRLDPFLYYRCVYIFQCHKHNIVPVGYEE